MNYDLETLRLIWWALLGVIAIGLAICEGLSLGVLLLLPVLANSDSARNSLIGSIAPTSLGNLAWLVAMMTVMFAAWPVAYAVSMASLQPALLMILLALLLRPLALYFADASEHPKWQLYSNKALAMSGWLPATLLGLLLGNLLKGIPFHLESDMRITFLGDFMGLLNLFALLVATTCIALLMMHGATYLLLQQPDSDVQQQAKAAQLRAGVAFLILFALTGMWISHLEGYHISSDIFPNAVSNPLAKFVKRGEGLWLDNYEHIPALIAIPTLAFIAVIASVWLAKIDRAYQAMLASTTAVGMATLTVGVSMFPFLLPSNLSLNSSLTIWDSSASLATLQALLSVSAFALPLLFFYCRWVFCLFSAKPG